MRAHIAKRSAAKMTASHPRVLGLREGTRATPRVPPWPLFASPLYGLLGHLYSRPQYPRTRACGADRLGPPKVCPDML